MMFVKPPGRTSFWIVLASVSLAAALLISGQSKRKRRQEHENTVKIAFIGNSIQYFNDCPRLIQQMVESTGVMDCIQDSCFRGGASIPSLWKQGNGMSKKFATEQALITNYSSNNNTELNVKPKYDIGSSTVEQLLRKQRWDFVVLNDYTQQPARVETVQETVEALKANYIPLLDNRHTIPVIIQTPAYRKEGIKDTTDLGNFEEFTNKLADGIRTYIDTFIQNGIDNVRVAPVGEAYRYLYRHNKPLWKKLYSWDDFHPSPYGTWLQACIIYCTCFNMLHHNDATATPPIYNPLWWEYSRYMQPPDQKPLPLPTEDEAMTLRQIACMICGIVPNDDNDNNNNERQRHYHISAL